MGFLGFINLKSWEASKCVQKNMKLPQLFLVNAVLNITAPNKKNVSRNSILKNIRKKTYPWM